MPKDFLTRLGEEATLSLQFSNFLEERERALLNRVAASLLRPLVEVRGLQGQYNEIQELKALVNPKEKRDGRPRRRERSEDD